MARKWPSKKWQYKMEVLKHKFMGDISYSKHHRGTGAISSPPAALVPWCPRGKPGISGTLPLEVKGPLNSQVQVNLASDPGEFLPHLESQFPSLVSLPVGGPGCFTPRDLSWPRTVDQEKEGVC